MIDLDATLALASDQGRICPMPQAWQRLYALLPNTRQKGSGWEPPLPLILGAWDFSSDDDKKRRLQEHLRWAAQNGALDGVHAFLLALPTDQWHSQ